MSRYDPLKEHLAHQSTNEVPMTFAEIEGVVGVRLPPSAYRHRAWWSNNPSNSVITYAWLGAGYETERVDMASRKLVFRKAGLRPAQTARAKPPAKHVIARDGQALFDELYGSMKGSMTIRAGFDLTAPTGEIWDANQ